MPSSELYYYGIPTQMSETLRLVRKAMFERNECFWESTARGFNNLAPPDPEPDLLAITRDVARSV